MKFKLDENVPLRLKAIISHAGHLVSDVYEQNLQGKDDSVLFKTCRKEGYVIITNDTDFENIQVYPPKTHSGIILFKLRSQGAKAVTRAWDIFITKVELNRVPKSTIIIGPDVIKIRK